MAAIRGRDTKPELVLRRNLHALGFRFRLHSKHLPGRPDMVFPKFQAVLFVNGCFWHGHGCDLFRWPKTREAFWRDKIGANVARDQRALTALQGAGWRTGVVWECAIKGRSRLEPAAMITAVANWLHSDDSILDLAGHRTATDQGD